MRRRESFLSVSYMFLGVIMGAGFTSGRESWQFFAVFGKHAYTGALLATCGFVFVSFMMTYVARSKKTSDIAKIVIPFENEKAEKALSIIIGILYYTMLIAMSAAGGSLLHYQFHINKAFGGVAIAFLAVATVLGDFDRVQETFKYLVPTLFIINIVTMTAVLCSHIGQSGAVTGYKPGSMTGDWKLAAMVFVCYNSIGMLSIAGDTALSVKSDKNAFGGAAFGTLLLGGITIMLIAVLQKDMAFSSSLDLPMLGYSMRLSKFLNFIFAIVLYAAIFSTATSTYYGFSTRISDENIKKGAILILGAIAAALLGLTGFKTIVEYLYPIHGYIGMAVITLLFVNFIIEVKKNRRRGRDKI